MYIEYMRSLKVIIIIIVFPLGCSYSQKKPFEKEVKELLESVYENKNIEDKKSSTTAFFHCKFESISDEPVFLVRVAYNQFTGSEKTCSIETVKGVKTFLYYENCAPLKNESLESKGYGAFFVPDSNSWYFLVRKYEDNYFFWELNQFNNIHNKVEVDDSFKL